MVALFIYGSAGMKSRILFSAVVAILVGEAVISESTGQSVVIERPKAAPARQEGIVRVQLQIQLFIPGPTDETEQAEKQRERARRILYEMAAKECDLMREVVARDCRLESVSVNLNRQNNPQVPQMTGYQVGGSMSYQITLK
jgi:hypothetical protein